MSTKRKPPGPLKSAHGKKPLLGSAYGGTQALAEASSPPGRSHDCQGNDGQDHSCTTTHTQACQPEPSLLKIPLTPHQRSAWQSLRNQEPLDSRVLSVVAEYLNSRGARIIDSVTVERLLASPSDHAEAQRQRDILELSLQESDDPRRLILFHDKGGLNWVLYSVLIGSCTRDERYAEPLFVVHEVVYVDPQEEGEGPLQAAAIDGVIKQILGSTLFKPTRRTHRLAPRPAKPSREDSGVFISGVAFEMSVTNELPRVAPDTAQLRDYLSLQFAISPESPFSLLAPFDILQLWGWQDDSMDTVKQVLGELPEFLGSVDEEENSSDGKNIDKTFRSFSSQVLQQWKNMSTRGREVQTSLCNLLRRANSNSYLETYIPLPLATQIKASLAERNGQRQRDEEAERDYGHFNGLDHPGPFFEDMDRLLRWCGETWDRHEKNVTRYKTEANVYAESVSGMHLAARSLASRVRDLLQFQFDMKQYKQAQQLKRNEQVSLKDLNRRCDDLSRQLDDLNRQRGEMMQSLKRRQEDEERREMMLHRLYEKGTEN